MPKLGTEFSPAVGDTQRERQEPAHEALARVLRSRTFERAPRLQAFLKCVCELALSGQSEAINESLIAIEVFKRGASYASGDDSIVRRQAHALRQKLQVYYAKEGLEDPIRIELPMGRYVPVFHAVPASVPHDVNFSEALRTTAPPVEPPPAEPPPVDAGGAARADDASVRRLARRRGRFVAFTLAAVALVAAGWFGGRLRPRGAARLQRERALPAVDPAVLDFWGPWLEGTQKRGVKIYLAIHAAAELNTGLGAPPRPQDVKMAVPEGTAAEAAFRRAFPTLGPGPLAISSRRDLTRVGSAMGATRMALLLQRLGMEVDIGLTTYLTRSALRGRGTIIVGGPDSHGRGDEVLQSFPLRVVSATQDAPRRIVNTAPGAGEQAVYEDVPGEGPLGRPEQRYALVSLVWEPDRGFPVLIVEGLHQRGTDVAMEMLTRGPELAGLVARLRALAPGHQGMWRFQAVLRHSAGDARPPQEWVVALKLLPSAGGIVREMLTHSATD